MSFILGLVLCAAAIAAIALAGGDPTMLLDCKALLFVLVGTIGVILITSPMQAFMKDLRCALKTLKKSEKPEKLITQIVELVQTARHQGILALEGFENKVTDPILKKGIALITGSADRETIESILIKDAQHDAGMEKAAQEFIERIAFISPGIGMIGTLVEIVQMLYTYKGPQTLAPGVGKSLIPVVYAGIVAYLILLPLASRVKSGSQRLKQQRELAIQGVLAIQSGEPPHIVEQRLSRFADGSADKREDDMDEQTS